MVFIAAWWRDCFARLFGDLEALKDLNMSAPSRYPPLLYLVERASVPTEIMFFNYGNHCNLVGMQTSEFWVIENFEQVTSYCEKVRSEMSH